MPEKTPDISKTRKAGSLSWSLILGGVVLVLIPIAIITPKMGSINTDGRESIARLKARSLAKVAANVKVHPDEPKSVFVRRVLPQLPSFKTMDDDQIARMMRYLELVDGKLEYAP